MVIPLVCVAEDRNIDALKAAAIDSIDQQREELVRMSESIWSHAEVALEESQSSKVLGDYAEELGFSVEWGIAGMPTAFMASYGEGRPVIAILGEFDALPRLSQAATPSQQALEPGGNGHGCGHNLFGVASLGAAAALKALHESGELSGTLRFYGTPAEEAYGGKIYMAREGLFSDVDVALSWHPSSNTEIPMGGSMAMVETIVDFKGTSSHAAKDPWNGRSALDGLELFTHALNLWREHVEPTVRIHYTYKDGGGAPNVVPATAAADVWIRDSELDSVMALYARMQEMATGAAMAADVDVNVALLSATYNIIHNAELARLVDANMRRLPPIEYTATEQAFARELQQAMGKPAIGIDASVAPLDFDAPLVSSGSTDTADVSWLVPTIEFRMTTAPRDIPWHSWGVVASSGSSLGQKGMLQASKVLAMTGIDLFTSPERVEAAKAQHREDVQGQTYEPFIPAGPPPLPAAD